VGHKALAVNLSDLAAMGAQPAWATLSLSLPAADEHWLSEFAAGFFSLAEQHGVELVGGDTVQGPRVITVQLHGFVPAGAALKRSGARAGDLVFVTGTLGDGGAGLALVTGELTAGGEDEAYLRGRLDRPTPRVEAGLALRGLASSAIDISDGLAADLGHVLARSGVGARVELGSLPLSSSLQRTVPASQATRFALMAGDDYELCFTVPPARVAELANLPVSCTQIGVIESAPGLRVIDAAGRAVEFGQAGYDHFAGQS
jgi:thiamine-monophosphate kinase